MIPIDSKTCKIQQGICLVGFVFSVRKEENSASAEFCVEKGCKVKKKFYDAEYEAALNSVTAEDIKTLMQAVLAQNNFIQIVLAPQE